MSKIKVINIPNADILETVKYNTKNTIIIKYEIYEVMGFRLANLHLNSINFKGQGQGHAHFDN